MKTIQTIKYSIAILLTLSFLAVSGAVAGEQVLLTGTIIKAKEGVRLLTDPTADRLKLEGKDLSEMMGKSVQVTGTLEENGSGKSIIVHSVEPARLW